MTSSREKARSEFAKWYSSLKAAPGTLQLFARNDEYFTAHGNVALTLADRYYKTRDIVTYPSVGDQKGDTAQLVIRPQKLPQILKDILVERKESVEIYRKNSSGVWSLWKKGSPGNLQSFEDMLSGESAVVMSVKLASTADHPRTVGVAFAETSKRRLEICEFEDNDKFSNLESVAVQRGAKECLVGFDSSVLPNDKKRVMDVFSRCGLPVKEMKSADTKSADVASDLAKLLKGGIELHFGELEKKQAMAALAALIKMLELKSSDGFNKYSLEPIDLDQFMKLDAAAVHALNLFPQPTDSDKNMNLFGLLNKGKTQMGTRLLRQWIQQPLRDVKAIERRLDFVEALVNDKELRENLMSQHFHKIPDLDRVSKRLQKGKGDLQVLITMYQFVIKLPPLQAALKDHEGKHAGLLHETFAEPIHDIIKELSTFEKLVENTIDLDAIDRHEYVVNPAFDPELGELSEAKKRVMKEIEALVKETGAKLDLDDGVKLNFVAQLGWHFRISRKAEVELRKHGNAYTCLETRKDGVRFTSMKMKKLSKEHEDFTAKYEKIQSNIVQQAMETARGYIPAFERVTALIAELDVFVGMAHIASNSAAGYCRPTILPQGSGILELKACRHPCMESLENMSASFVANDVSLIKGKSNVQIITGPNMGGKSTYIRQVGVVTLMAQMGCFVPCESATVTVVDCILARVGAGDSQLKGVSTFMKEMLEAGSIIRAATPDSLVIIDELGRGTSTYDGFGLAWAISEYIATEIGAFAMFATHFHELTALAASQPSVVNKHVTADASHNAITMLYTVRDGPCDRSFGIHVAELAQFPSEVVEAARRKAAELEDFGKQAQILDAVGNASPSKLSLSGAKRSADQMSDVGSGKDEKKSDEDFDMENVGETTITGAKRVRLASPEEKEMKRALSGGGGKQLSQADAVAFLKDFAAMPLATMSEADAMSAVRAKLDALPAAAVVSASAAPKQVAPASNSASSSSSSSSAANGVVPMDDS